MRCWLLGVVCRFSFGFVVGVGLGERGVGWGGREGGRGTGGVGEKSER